MSSKKKDYVELAKARNLEASEEQYIGALTGTLRGIETARAQLARAERKHNELVEEGLGGFIAAGF